MAGAAAAAAEEEEEEEEGRGADFEVLVFDGVEEVGVVDGVEEVGMGGGTACEWPQEAPDGFNFLTKFSDKKKRSMPVG
jgi:hypothetical protein